MIRRFPLAAWLTVSLAVVGCAPPASSLRPGSPTTVSTSAPTSVPASAPTSSPSASTSAGPMEQRQERSLPQPREELAAAELDGTLFVIAGFDAAGRDTNTVFTYHGTWSLGPPLPEALDHPAAASLLGRLYVAGGFSAGRARATVYRLAQEHWERIAPLHHPRAALALIALRGRLYALGGRNSAMTSVAISEVYDPVLGSWSDLPALPDARHHVAGFAYQEMACVAGGKFPYTARVDCLDPTTRTWHRMADLPQATSGAVAITVAGHPVVVGGEGDTVVPWMFSLIGASWQREEMLLPRHGTGVAILNDRAWVCGGAAVAGLHPTSVCTSINVVASART